MFASHKRFESNLELNFIYDKELPFMGSISERYVLPISDRLCNPKEGAPHTKTFSMHKKNDFVAQDNYVLVTPAQQALLELVATKTKARELYIYLFEILMLSTYQVDKDLINQEAACGVLLLLRALRALQAPSPLSLSNNSKTKTS